MTTEEIKKAAEKGGEMVIDMNDLKGVIQEVMKGADLGVREEFKKYMSETVKKELLPDGDKGITQAAGGSIINTGVFQKDFGQGRGQMSGAQVATTLRSCGGPFLSLSKEMESFATILSCGGDFRKAEARGVSLGEYNEMVKEQHRKVLGQKALTTTDAGALVPIEFLATMVEFATAQSQILPKLWRLPMGGQMLRIPMLVQESGSYFGGIVLYHPGEGGKKTPTKPVFDQIALTAKKLIGLCPITDELVMDSSINIVNYVSGLFMRAFQWQAEHEVLQGVAANDEMAGIIPDLAINVVPRNVPGTVTFPDLINLDSSLDENFQNLTFVTRRATVNQFRVEMQAGGATNQPIYVEGFSTALGPIMVPQLMGYPIVRTRNVPAMGIRGDIVLGDFGFYIWAVRQDMTVDQSRDFRFDYDETTLRFVVRQDGVPGVPIAFSVLDGTLS